MSGLDPAAGLVAPSATDLKAQEEAALKAGPLGQSAGSEPDGSIPVRSLAGQWIAIWVDGLSALWDLGLAIYSALDPATSSGAALDALCAITGTRRTPASFSTVVATACGTPGTVLAANRVASVAVSGTRFDLFGPSGSSAGSITIALLSSWAPATPYTVGQRVTNLDGSVHRCYQCITAGNSGGGVGPTGLGADILDPGGTAHWTYLGDGTGAADGFWVAEISGPLAAVNRQLTTIATPVAGWNTVRNLIDATLGANVEIDSDLRLRRQVELTAEGAGSPDSIRAAFLRLDQNTNTPVIACVVFRNNTDLTDANGLPPHSVEIMVQGGIDADVANLVFKEVAAGIAYFGNTTAVVVDSTGKNQTIKYTRPVAVPIYVRADVTYDPALFPATGGAAAIAEAIVLEAQKDYPIGKSVRASSIEASVFDSPSSVGGSPVPGILDVTVLFIGTAPAPVSGATIPIAARQIATFDTSRVTVNLTTGTP